MALKLPQWRLAVVRIGFVVEGASERKFIESTAFNDFTFSLGIKVCFPVIDAKGGGNLCSANIEKYIVECRSRTKADKIFVLTDLECDPCITQTKERVASEGIDAIIVAKKAIESWFIADDQLMSQWLKESFHVDYPEETQEHPFDFLRIYCAENQKKGPGNSHKFFTRKMLNNGFSLERAAQHPNCPSAQYFIRKLREAVVQ